LIERETKAEKAAQKVDLDIRNTVCEASDRERWEAVTASRRSNLTRKDGVKLKWVHTKGNRVYVVKKGKGGINWYRCREKLLKPLLIPFVYKWTGFMADGGYHQEARL
jgi:hypothetical protein